jgi:hypothetical protein
MTNLSQAEIAPVAVFSRTAITSWKRRMKQRHRGPAGLKKKKSSVIWAFSVARNRITAIDAKPSESGYDGLPQTDVRGVSLALSVAV